MASCVGASVPGFNNTIHLTTQPSSRFKQIKSFFSSLPSMMTIVKVIGLALLCLPNAYAHVSPNCPSLTDLPMGCALNNSGLLYPPVCHYRNENGKRVMYREQVGVSSCESIKWAPCDSEVYFIRDATKYRSRLP